MFNERRNVVPTITFAKFEPVIYVAPMALQKMYFYVKGCSKEIGWLGKVKEYEGRQYLIEDVYLFEQEVHSATCEIKPEGLAKFVTDLFTNEESDKAMDIANNLKVWGHSHVNMGVSPSGQDDNQMKVFADANEWFIRVIANKSGEMEFTLYDFKLGLQFKNVKWMEYRPVTNGLEELINAEIKQKVSEKTYTHNYVNPNSHYNWMDDDNWENGVYVGHLKKTNATTKSVVTETKTKEGDAFRKSETIFIPDETDKNHWRPVEKYTEEGEVNPKVIVALFTDRDLKEIAIAQTISDAEDIIMMNSAEDFDEEDVLSIYMYAVNKYPA